MQEIKINVGFRKMRGWRDSKERAKHVFDRMKDRGIGLKQIEETIRKGAKRIRKDKSIFCEFSAYKIVYREFIVQNHKKIYPITVMED